MHIVNGCVYMCASQIAILLKYGISNWGFFVVCLFCFLVSRVHSGALTDKDVISREDHELETEKLELEIQHCKEMIKTQQQLLQVGVF